MRKNLNAFKERKAKNQCNRVFVEHFIYTATGNYGTYSRIQVHWIT